MTDENIREALEKAAAQFRFYEREHRAKALVAMTTGPTHAAIEKTETNRQFAEMCEAALSKREATVNDPPLLGSPGLNDREGRSAVMREASRKDAGSTFGLPWHIAPWGDGSNPSYVNICSDSQGVVVVADLEREIANFIMKSANLSNKQEVPAALPPGRNKQDIANLVDLALSDSIVELGNGDGSRFDYDIMVEKLRGNDLALVALSTKQEAGEVSRSQTAAPPSVRSQTLEEALREWKCPECDGVGQLKRAQRLGGGFRKCDMCGGARLHPIAAAALSPLPAPDAGWRDITSAPKDRLIDIWIKNDDGSGVRWADCYYDRICGQWRTSRPGGLLVTVPERAVTHWREPPLPAPPVGDAGEKS